MIAAGGIYTAISVASLLKGIHGQCSEMAVPMLAIKTGTIWMMNLCPNNKTKHLDFNLQHHTKR